MECLDRLEFLDRMECLDRPEWSILTDQSVLTDLDFMYWLVVSKNPIYQLWRVRGWVVGGWVGVFGLKSQLWSLFEILYEFWVSPEMLDHSVSETRVPSLTIVVPLLTIPLIKPLQNLFPWLIFLCCLRQDLVLHDSEWLHARTSSIQTHWDKNWIKTRQEEAFYSVLLNYWLLIGL